MIAVSCPEWLPSISTALDVTVVMVALASLLTSAELVALRGEFRPHGLFDVRVGRAVESRPLAARLAWVPLASIVQIPAAIGVLVCVSLDVSATVPLCVLAATSVVRTMGLRYGLDGSDSMGLILTIAVAIASLSTSHVVVVRIALAFIAAQLCLAYGASGAAKMFGRPWRSGLALRAILHTEFGHPRLARVFDRQPTSGKVLAWAVIGVELAFPIAVVVGGWFALGALGALGLLQVAIAFAMGLNRFLPWFLVAYPATAWASCQYGLVSS